MKRLGALALVVALVGGWYLWRGRQGQPTALRGRAEVTPSGRADMRELVASDTAFAVALYQEVAAGDDNLVLSPYSTSLTLALASAGARGETQLEMVRALRLGLRQEQIAPAYNALDQDLWKRAGHTVQLARATGVWLRRGEEAPREFTEFARREYGAEVRLVDFGHAPDRARDEINAWAKRATLGRVRGLIAREGINAETIFVLADAFHLKAKWQERFRNGNTETGEFTRLDGTKVEAHYMCRIMSFNYGEGEEYQALELPYQGGEFSMVFLLPAEGDFHSFERALTPEKLGSVFASLKPARDLERGMPTIFVPRFTFASGFRLREPLSRLGMPRAFAPGSADFSGIRGETWVSDVWHRATITVNEEGTEAGAASALVGTMFGGVREFRANRPFLFFIRDRGTNAILFMGRVMDPRGE